MKAECYLWVCPGQGQQASLDLDALRPQPEDPIESHTLWEAMHEALGQDPGRLWTGLTHQEREHNKQAQWGVVLYQVLKGFKLRASGIPMDWAAGYSVGELSALSLAGSIPVEALPNLVLTRARLMSGAILNPDALPCLVLLSERLPAQARASRQAALDTLGIARAIQRSSAESVWGGPPEAIATFLREAKAQGWNARALPVSIPSHTPYLSPAIEDWRQALEVARLQDLHTPVLSGVDGTQIRSAKAAQKALLDQLVHTLEWDATLKLCPEYGVSHVVDLGPGEDQWRLIEAIDPTLVRVEV